MVTTIQVSDELWKALIQMKQRGETFEDVLRRKLKIKKEEEKQNDNRRKVE